MIVGRKPCDARTLFLDSEAGGHDDRGTRTRYSEHGLEGHASSGGVPEKDLIGPDRPRNLVGQVFHGRDVVAIEIRNGGDFESRVLEEVPVLRMTEKAG